MPLTLAPTGGPVHLTHARGYLFLAAPTGVAVFNTTGFDNRRGPKMLLAHPYSSVASHCAPESMVTRSLHVFVDRCKQIAKSLLLVLSFVSVVCPDLCTALLGHNVSVGETSGCSCISQNVLRPRMCVFCLSGCRLPCSCTYVSTCQVLVAMHPLCRDHIMCHLKSPCLAHV